MKILHIIYALGNGGAENMLVDIINEQIILGNNVQLIVINNIVDKEVIKPLNNKTVFICLGRSENSRNIFYFIKLYFHLITIRPNIVHCHNITLGKILKLYFKKKVVTVHDVGLSSELLDNYNKIFAISKAVQNDLLINGGFNSTVVYNGIKVNRIITKNNFNNDCFEILQISSLIHEKKGQDLLINAIFEIVKENKNIHLTFIGGGASYDYLSVLVKKLRLENHITFLGNKSREYVYNSINQYDLLVQPSRFEGFGLTVIEGMVAKIPVLVSNINGPMEIICEGEYGYYFESNNTKSLANKINEIMITDTNSIVEKAYCYTCNNFDIKLTAKNYIENY